MFRPLSPFHWAILKAAAIFQYISPFNAERSAAGGVLWKHRKIHSERKTRNSSRSNASLLPFLPVRQINAEKGFAARMAQRVFVFKNISAALKGQTMLLWLPRSAIQLKFF
jgi:hypothetical protein